MARNDVRIRDTGPYSAPAVWEWSVAAGTPPTIKAGEPTKIGTLPNIILLADADPEDGTDVVVGIAATDSGETSGATGVVQVYMPLPGIVYECKAKTATAADTASEIEGLKGKAVVFDLTTGTFTIDTAATNDNSSNGVLIAGGDYTNSIIYFFIKENGTVLGGQATTS